MVDYFLVQIRKGYWKLVVYYMFMDMNILVFFVGDLVLLVQYIFNFQMRLDDVFVVLFFKLGEFFVFCIFDLFENQYKYNC